MDSPALVALLQEAVPGARIESAPSIDLQTTLYVERDDVPAVAQVLRDRPDLRFALLAELGRVQRPVLLKRGLSATIQELLMSAEYIMAHGNHQVVPVDVYVPGCPPRPESLIYGIVQLQRKIAQQKLS